MKKWLRSYSYVALIVLVGIYLSIANYTPGTWLTGWDNLHPEFNFKLNIERSLSAVWQEYQGLGLLGGMSHASDIFRQLILWAFSLVLPISFLRYFWQFLMLILGPIGAYFFIKDFILTREEQKDWKEPVAFLGAMFYLMNLATLLTFYAPISTFTTQYGFLPWLLLYVTKYVSEGKKRHLFAFLVLSLVSSTQAYTGTLFFAYFLFLVVYLFFVSNQYSKGLRKSAISLALLVAVNLYWILPLGYFVATKSYVVGESTINRLASEESFLLNKRHGDINSVALLKGFWFDNSDYSLTEGRFIKMLQPWIEHTNQLYVAVIGYLLFAVVLLGTMVSILKKDLRVYPILFLLCVFFLMNANPPFSYFFGFLQDKVPLFREALRFPYTKFSILSAFSYALLFSIGFSYLVSLIKKYQYLTVVPMITALVALVCWFYPAFQSNLIYKELRVDIPSEYFALFDWFKSHKEGRVLNLPLDSYWGWPRYRWGYRGSGFLWYGIENPILDRAFDVWSDKNEAAFREISYALYSGKNELLQTVLKKYGIRYLLVDKNAFSPISSKVERALSYGQIDDYIRQQSSFQKTATFGQIEIFENMDKDDPKTEPFDEVYPAVHWTFQDSVYEKFGDYYTVPKINQNTLYFPFARIDEPLNNYKDFTVEKKDTTVEISINNLPDLSGVKAFFPSVNQESDVGKLAITATRNGPEILMTVSFSLPDLLINGSSVSGRTFSGEYSLKTLGEPLAFVISNEIVGTIDSFESQKVFDSVYTTLSNIQNIKVYSLTPSSKLSVLEDLLPTELDTCAPGREGSYGVERLEGGMKVYSKNTEGCLVLSGSKLSAFLKPGLIEVSLKYASQSTYPSYCLYDKDNDKCLNDVKKYSSVTGDGFLNEYMVVDTQRESNFILYSRLPSGYVPGNEVSTKYSDIEIGYFPQLYSVDLSNIGENFIPSESVAFEKIESIKILLPLSIKPARYTFREDFSLGYRPETHKTCNGEESPDVLKSVDNGTLSLKSSQNLNCEHINMPDLDNTQSYLMGILHQRVSGQNQQICVSRTAKDHCDIMDKLESPEGELAYDWLITPGNRTTEKIDLRIDNLSIDDVSENEYNEVVAIPVPTEYLKNIYFGSADFKVASTIHKLSSGATKVGTFLYTQGVDYRKDDVLLLDQAYNSGWLIFCDWKICDAQHVQANNWQNGWIFNSNFTGTARILYLPQMLELLGFLIMVNVLVFSLIRTPALKQ